ncbi:hypothetical protein SAMN04487830_10232 [Pseudobutyrivibrio sp. OR37]|nr:hypothetical protein [Pseudobutyrivibrio sp. OR37]SFH56701.1 hypothetical protein SAMN04487830_10232 [Pseudobutyrivibrio sp. OR37]
MYYRISEWIDSVMKNGMPKDVISVCFNLYDDISVFLILIKKKYQIYVHI